MQGRTEVGIQNQRLRQLGEIETGGEGRRAAPEVIGSLPARIQVEEVRIGPAVSRQLTQGTRRVSAMTRYSGDYQLIFLARRVDKLDNRPELRGISGSKEDCHLLIDNL